MSGADHLRALPERRSLAALGKTPTEPMRSPARAQHTPSRSMAACRHSGGGLIRTRSLRR